MALTPKLKFLPALKIAELAKASPCIRLGAGAFLRYVAPKFLRQKLPARGHYFFIDNTQKGLTNPRWNGKV